MTQPDSFNDKHNLLPTLSKHQTVELELGCGNRKRLPNSIGIDMLDYEAVDIVGDIVAVLAAFPENSVDFVTSHHVFEHLDNLEELLDQLARVIKPNGQFEATVPHFSNPYYYSDYTHKRFFGLYTFCYLASSSLFQRQVPTYQRVLTFELTAVDLAFKSPPPFYVRYGIKRVWGALFNINYWMQEFYEENLCYLIPCYEIRYVLRRL